MDRQIPDHIHIALEQTEARARAVVIVDLSELVLQAMSSRIFCTAGV